MVDHRQSVSFHYNIIIISSTHQALLTQCGDKATIPNKKITTINRIFLLQNIAQWDSDYPTVFQLEIEIIFLPFPLSACRYEDGTVRLRNPHIELMDQDILYHLALGSGSHDLQEMFGDVKVGEL